ncbi:hypothetical protein B0H11DRAFT_2245274 [Mycena galericulata]|nr:hypothetical protein B0H11DRAFT_2245274 [Mycena galericulata]
MRATTEFQLPDNLTERQKHAYTLFSPSMKPAATEPQRCDHMKSRKFNLILGDKNPSQAGDITAFVPMCKICPKATKIINTVTPEQRVQFLHDLNGVDSDSDATPPPAPMLPPRKSSVRSSAAANGKGKAKEDATPRKAAVPKPKAKEATTPKRKTVVKDKGKAKETVTPPRKKTKRESANVSPAVPTGPTPVSGPTVFTKKFIELYVYMEASHLLLLGASMLITMQAKQEALRSTFDVPDTQRFRFADTDLFDVTHAGGGEDAPVYVRYSPHRGAFTPPEDSGVLGTTNISESGSVLIYREKTLSDEDCPGLFKLIFELHASGDCISHPAWPSFPPAPSQPVAGPSNIKRSSRKRVREDDLDEIEDTTEEDIDEEDVDEEEF